MSEEKWGITEDKKAIILDGDIVPFSQEMLDAFADATGTEEYDIEFNFDHEDMKPSHVYFNGKLIDTSGK